MFKVGQRIYLIELIEPGVKYEEYMATYLGLGFKYGQHKILWDDHKGNMEAIAEQICL